MEQERCVAFSDNYKETWNECYLSMKQWMPYESYKKIRPIAILWISIFIYFYAHIFQWLQFTACLLLYA